MAKYKKEEIVKAKVIGLQNYGAFVEVCHDHVPRRRPPRGGVN